MRSRRPATARILAAASLGATLALGCASDGTAEEAAAKKPAPAPAAAEPLAPAPNATIDDLVGPIALYPDPLLAVVLPASTYPLDLVQADRFLDRLEKDSTLQPDAAWHESVRNLLNTPDVVRTLVANLEWTIRLGEHVTADPAAVMDAIQRFRLRVHAAGNLDTDEKQAVSVEDDVVTIQSADPKIVYVPTYDPEVVMLPAQQPVVAYYPDPYPWYYYPYGYGAAAWTAGAFFWGSTAWAMGWAHHEIWHDVHWDDIDDIGDFDNVDWDKVDDRRDDFRNDLEGKRNDWQSGQKPEGGKNKPGEGNRPGGGERPSTLPSKGGERPSTRPSGGRSEWKPGSGSGAVNRPSQLPATRPSTRPGDAGYRPSTRPAQRPSGGIGAAGGGGYNLPSYGDPNRRPSQRPSGGGGLSQGGGVDRPSTRPSNSFNAGSGSFGGYDRARDMRGYSDRGKASRSGSGSYNRGSGSYERSRAAGGYSRGGSGGGYNRSRAAGGGGGRSGGGRGRR
jgi:hypothetical protein